MAPGGKARPISTEVELDVPVGKLVDLLAAALPGGAALHEPTFGGREWEFVKDCLDSGWVSSVGGYVDKFEEMLRDRVGCEDCIATVNGTSALHVLLRALDLRPGEEIIVPALTFVATASAVTHAGGIPHFADIHPATLGLDPSALRDHLAEVGTVRDGRLVNKRNGAVIRAVVAVHTFGHPCDLPALSAVAEEFGLDLIEDAAESLGSLRDNRPTGAAGLAGILSFNGNKTVTTGGGGAVVTNNRAFGERVRYLATTAKEPHRWLYIHNEAGFNYRLPNINAALGCAQLEQLDEFVILKRRLADWYRDRISGIAGVEFVDEPANCASNFWLNAVLMDDQPSRDAVLQRANDLGIGLRPAWEPMHRLPMYKACPRADLPVTEEICARLVNLPSGVSTARTVLGGPEA